MQKNILKLLLCALMGKLKFRWLKRAFSLFSAFASCFFSNPTNHFFQASYAVIIFGGILFPFIYSFPVDWQKSKKKNNFTWKSNDFKIKFIVFFCSKYFLCYAVFLSNIIIAFPRNTFLLYFPKHLILNREPWTLNSRNIQKIAIYCEIFTEWYQEANNSNNNKLKGLDLTSGSLTFFEGSNKSLTKRNTGNICQMGIILLFMKLILNPPWLKHILEQINKYSIPFVFIFLLWAFDGELYIFSYFCNIPNMFQMIFSYIFFYIFYKKEK